MNYNPSRKPEFLTRLTGIIMNNLVNEQFNVSGLAGEMGMSRSSLHRRLKALTGLTTSQFIRKLKLEKAMEMLETTSSNISEIALECGFRSISYFDKCFRDHFGLAPNRVRQDLLNGEDPESTLNGRVKTGSLQNQKRSRNRLHNFPNAATSFIGREQEIAELTQLLNVYKIVSLVGSGGCGKTRLACETVVRLNRLFKDGIWFVDLSPVENGELVVKEVMETLLIPEVPGKDLMDNLLDRIRDKQLLIILDNCEHLLSSCAALAETLMQAVPGLQIMVTSREVLNIKGELVWRIPTLSLIDPVSILEVEMALDSEAILLFEDRATLSDPRFALEDNNIREVATICNRVDGIPLALELVASRTRHMDPSTMLERLADRFSELPSPYPGTIQRHKTLNATIAWSYNLLTREQQDLFRRLSIFNGGFDLQAAEEVCSNESLPKESILDLLSDLVDQSMVYTIRNRNEVMRYGILETLRQYGSGLFMDGEANLLKKQHLDYYSDLAERAYRERLTSQQLWMEKLQLEHDNLIAALQWSDQQDPVRYAWLAGTLTWFWSRSGNFMMTRQFMEKIISTDYAGPEANARALTGYGKMLGTNIDEIPKGISMLKHGADLWHGLKNTNEEALALTDLAIAYYGAADDESGVKYAKEAYALAQIDKDPGVELYSMMALSQGYVDLKQFREARIIANKIICKAEELGNLFAQFAGHHNLADCALMEGQFDESEKEYGRGIEITRQYGDIVYTCIDLTGLAMSVAGQGRYAKALRLNAVAAKTGKESGMMAPEELPLKFWQELLQIHIKATREKLGVSLTRKYEAEGRAMSLDEAVAYALDFGRD